MENSLEQKTETEKVEKNPGKLRKILGRAVLIGALGLAGLVGVRGCNDRISAKLHGNEAVVNIKDRAGITKAYITNTKGKIIKNLIYRKDSEPFSFTIDLSLRSIIESYLPIKFKDSKTTYKEKFYLENSSEKYFLIYEDGEGDITKVPLENN